VASSSRVSTQHSVFINCPFDRAYRPIFFASIFAVHYCGFLARSALEISDTTQPRLHTICDLIVACRFGIHDLSRTGLEPANALPRFNMPFELGLFLGCQRFGGQRHRVKSALVFDKEPYRYQQFLSDISGQDIVAHHDDPRQALVEIRNWLQAATRRPDIAGGSAIWEQFQEFQRDLPQIATHLRLSLEELTFLDYRYLISVWQQQRDPSRTLTRL
jgi:hypothetical protein